MFNSYQQVIRVNGEQGARAFQMMPNSSVLLLDETAPLVWLKQTDGAGYPTVTAFKIEPYVPQPQPDLNTLMQRLAQLEERISDNEQSKSNSSSSTSKK